MLTHITGMWKHLKLNNLNTQEDYFHKHSFVTLNSGPVYMIVLESFSRFTEIENLKNSLKQLNFKKTI